MQKRHFQRVPFNAEVELLFAEQNQVCNLLDIALKGALLEIPPPFELAMNSLCNLCITLPDTSICLDFHAQLVHREGDHFGFKFISEDLETFTHLRRLLELNSGDPEGVREELNEWLIPHL